MARIRSATLGACSLLLLAATLLMWFRGYRARDGVWYSTDSTRYGLHSYRGRAWLWTLDVAPTPTAMVWTTPAKIGPGWTLDSAPDGWYERFASLGPRRLRAEDLLDAPFGGSGTGATVVDRGALGFRYVRNDAWYPRAQLMHGYPAVTSTVIAVPHVAIATAAAVWPGVIVWRRVRSRRRATRGLCVTCGYDLRGSPDGRCSECGATGATPADARRVASR